MLIFLPHHISGRLCLRNESTAPDKHLCLKSEHGRREVSQILIDQLKGFLIYNGDLQKVGEIDGTDASKTDFCTGYNGAAAGIFLVARDGKTDIFDITGEKQATVPFAFENYDFNYRSGDTDLLYLSQENRRCAVYDLNNNTVSVLCDGIQYSQVTADASGKASATVPDVSSLTYRYGDYTVTGTVIASGPFSGYLAINLKGVVDPVPSTEISMTIRYIATSSMQNTETPTNVDVLNSPVSCTYRVGTTQVFRAPELNGFTFSGWEMNGKMVSDGRDKGLCTLEITGDMDGSTLVASYAAKDPEQPAPDYGTVIAIGMVSVTIALLALIYVLLQIRRY